MRLISDKDLKDRASEYCLSEDEFRRFCKIIDEEPVAYDVDKVVKELEEWSFNADVNVGDGAIMNQNLIARDNAIKIVKTGGENDE